MNGRVAACAIAGCLQAVIAAAVRDCCTTDLFRVAAQAERTGIAEFQHVARRASMLFVTCRAAVDRAGVVFVDERSAFLLVTGDAERLRLGAKLMRLVTAMGIVAVRAVQHALGQAVVRRLVKVGTRRLMAA